MSIFAPIFAHDAERPAAFAGKTTIAYGRLCADIDSMARWLFAQGLEPGDRVTVHPSDVGNTGYWDWIMHLGALRAGLVQSTGPILRFSLTRAISACASFRLVAALVEV